MPDQGGEKTEKASPKKRQDERKKGNIFMSKDITVIAALVSSFFIIRLFAASFISRIQTNYQNQMVRAASIETLTGDDMMSLFTEGMTLFGMTILPAMVLIGVVTVLVVMLQSRFLISTESIKFKLERISIIKGFKRLFSLRSLVELFKSIIKICVLTWILYKNISASMVYLPNMIDWDIMQGAVFAGEEIISLIISVGIAFGAVSVVDYFYQWWEYEKNIKMTKQEVKDEYKQMEGNPEIRSARRQKQREFAQRRMMQSVKEADVIVRNPTHYAVALKYQIDKDPAPMVLAKGADDVALRIVEEGEKHNVSTVENKPLARGLYETAEIGGFIPAEFYQSVAELLAWLYSTKENGKGIG